MIIESCPVVHPTREQFNDFLAYTEYLEKTYSNNYGMVKVINCSFRLYPQKDGRLVRMITHTLTTLTFQEQLSKTPLEKEDSMNALIFLINL